MDSTIFDRLTRNLATEDHSRRRAVRGILAGLLVMMVPGGNHARAQTCPRQACLDECGSVATEGRTAAACRAACLRLPACPVTTSPPPPSNPCTLPSSQIECTSSTVCPACETCQQICSTSRDCFPFPPFCTTTRICRVGSSGTIGLFCTK
jgi:hypothetical protein